MYKLEEAVSLFYHDKGMDTAKVWNHDSNPNLVIQTKSLIFQWWRARSEVNFFLVLQSHMGWTEHRNKAHVLVEHYLHLQLQSLQLPNDLAKDNFCSH